MRTKTLLLGVGAVLAAGLTAVQAQTVYSANVVGYVNTAIPANSYQVMANQLVNGSDANQTNNDINNVFTGLISSPANNASQDPSISSNSVLYYWAGSSFSTYYYFNSADATTWGGVPPTGGWYDGATGNRANLTLPQGQSAFILNHFSGPITVTVVGTVVQGTNTAVINPGYNFISLIEPVSTNPVGTSYGLPLSMTSSNDVNTGAVPNQNINDTIFAWSGTSYSTYYYFNSADATYWENSGGSTPAYPAGFYDGATGNPMPASAYPQVNQGFFLYHSGAAINWTNVFTVQ